MKDTKPHERAAGSTSAVAELGRAIRERRAVLGLRQEDVADLAGCSERFVHALERGKETSQLGKTLEVLAVLGLGLRLVEGRGEISASSDRSEDPS